MTPFKSSSSRGQVSRRGFLEAFGGGFGSLALLSLLEQEALSAVPTARGDGAFRLPHHLPKVKRVIQLFMNGGASPMDLFDYKPELTRRHGEVFSPGAGVRVEAATSEPGRVLKSPFEFQRRGQSGQWVSSQLPHLAECVDDIAFLMAMVSKTNVHGPGSYLMNTGFLLPGFPCLGSWVSYALGRIADNLPTFVALPDAKGLPYNQKGNFSSGFLPVQHQATLLQPSQSVPMLDLKPAADATFVTEESSREGLDLLRRMNRQHLATHGPEPKLEGRIEAYELAAKLQLSAPEAFDLSRESETTRRAYGIDQPLTDDFGRRCLLARRLVERGVRFVQVWSGAGGPTGNWDNHTSIVKELPPMCAATDQPTAALLRDLKSRGLLEDTLLLWNTEFGRMPFSQGSEGRDHNGGTFVGWMAGAGVRGGVRVGESDEWGWKAAQDPVSNYDFHATVLHLLGLNHESLTFRHGGANRRLTDVHGHVISSVLA